MFRLIKSSKHSLKFRLLAMVVEVNFESDYNDNLVIEIYRARKNDRKGVLLSSGVYDSSGGCVAGNELGDNITNADNIVNKVIELIHNKYYIVGTEDGLVVIPMNKLKKVYKLYKKQWIANLEQDYGPNFKWTDIWEEQPACFEEWQDCELEHGYLPIGWREVI